MIHSTTGRLTDPGNKFEWVSALDTPKKGVLARWMEQREEQPKPAPRGIFNDHRDLYDARHVAGLAAHRNRNQKDLA